MKFQRYLGTSEKPKEPTVPREPTTTKETSDSTCIPQGNRGSLRNVSDLLGAHSTTGRKQSTKKLAMHEAALNIGVNTHDQVNAYKM